MADTPAKYRVQFDFVPEAYAELNELQEKLKASTKAEVVRYAIRTLQWVVSNMEDDNQIFVDDGVAQKEVIFPFMPASNPRRKKHVKPESVLT